MIECYVVIYLDYGQTTDGLVRVLSSYKDFKEAYENMESDVQSYINQNNLEITTKSESHIVVGNEEQGCQWQVLKIQI